MSNPNAAEDRMRAAEERAERLRHSLSGLLIYAALADDDAARGGG